MNNDKSIEFVKRFLIPFVNAKSDKEKLESFENIAREGISFLLDKPNLTIANSIKLDLNIEKVNQIYETITKMLRIALIHGEYHRLYPDTKEFDDIKEFEKPNDLELRIKKALKHSIDTYCYLWRGLGLNLATYTNINLDKDFHLDIESIIIELIFDIFESRLLIKDDKNGIKQAKFAFTAAIGYQYFAICPKCGKFFYKKRKDMIFDSEKCRAIVLQKRYIAKKKK